MKATLLCLSLIITSLVLVTQIGAKVDRETAMGIWLFDENKGAMATDISGNNNHGQIQFAEWVTGKFGKALKFNGVTSRVVIADSESLYAKKAWTITSWIEVEMELITALGRVAMVWRGTLSLWKAVLGKVHLTKVRSKKDNGYT